MLPTMATAAVAADAVVCQFEVFLASRKEVQKKMLHRSATVVVQMLVVTELKLKQHVLTLTVATFFESSCLGILQKTAKRKYLWVCNCVANGKQQKSKESRF